MFFSIPCTTHTLLTILYQFVKYLTSTFGFSVLILDNIYKFYVNFMKYHYLISSILRLCFLGENPKSDLRSHQIIWEKKIKRKKHVLIENLCSR